MPIVWIRQADWNAVKASLARIEASQQRGLHAMSAISDQVANLRQKIEPLESAQEGAITLLQGLSKQLSDALANSADDAAAVAAIGQIAAQLNTDTGNLAAAVVANTPADPNAPPTSAPTTAPPSA